MPVINIGRTIAANRTPDSYELAAPGAYLLFYDWAHECKFSVTHARIHLHTVLASAMSVWILCAMA